MTLSQNTHAIKQNASVNVNMLRWKSWVLHVFRRDGSAWPVSPKHMQYSRFPSQHIHIDTRYVIKSHIDTAYVPLYFTIFIHLVVCLTTGPKPLPNRVLHIVRSRASSFKCEYPYLSLRSSSSFLRFLPRLPVTSMLPFIFPSITRCRRQFLRKLHYITTKNITTLYIN